MKISWIAAAEGVASLVKEPSFDMIIPSPFQDGVAEIVAKAVADNVNKN